MSRKQPTDPPAEIAKPEPPPSPPRKQLMQPATLGREGEGVGESEKGITLSVDKVIVRHGDVTEATFSAGEDYFGDLTVELPGYELVHLVRRFRTELLDVLRLLGRFDPKDLVNYYHRGIPAYGEGTALVLTMASLRHFHTWAVGYGGKDLKTCESERLMESRQIADVRAILKHLKIRP